jgi:polyisoprenoid-binding protein YceI
MINLSRIKNNLFRDKLLYYIFLILYLGFEIKNNNQLGEFKMAKFTVDQAHSAVGFEVKHMMVSKVKGQFDAYTADVEAADLTDLTTASIAFKIDVASINTRNEDRDNHLKSADFFDAETNPSIDFKSTSITKDGEDYKVTGDLTIKGVTKPVTFDVEFGGKGTNPWGVEVYGFEAETKINREEFGLTWNAALETGGVLVGKDIKIKVELEVNPAA